MSKVLLRGTVVLLLLLSVTATWLLGSRSGARFAVDRAISATGGKLSVADVQGTLAGPLQLRDLRWRDIGTDVHVAELNVNVALMALIGGTLHVSNVDIANVQVALTSQATTPATETVQFSLVPPLPIQLDTLRIAKIELQQDGTPLFAADSIAIGAEWTSNNFHISQFKVRAPDGEVDLDATLNSLSDYTGKANSTLRWRIGDQQFAGTLQASGADGKLQAQLQLQQPAPMTVQIGLKPAGQFPWTLSVQAPAFDAAKLHAPDSVQTLAADLQAQGDRNGATLQGWVEANAHRVTLEPAQISLVAKALEIRALTLRSSDAAGTLTANGRIELGGTLPDATLDLEWNKVELPADLLGQALRSHGTLAVRGTPETFSADGKFALAADEVSADIQLQLHGTPQALVLDRIDVRQPKGQLSLSGNLDLQPTLRWDLQATAEQWDPSLFAQQWPGALNFHLASRGALGDAGVEATLQLDKVSGQLRQRPISATAQLSLKPGYAVEGSIALASGDSNFALRGHGGDTSDAHIGFEIASLADFLPDAQGNLRGQFEVQGRWPALKISGHVDAKKLGLGDHRIETLRLDASIDDASDQRGSAQVKVFGVTSAGLTFEQINIDVQGDSAAHTLSVDATGKPLTLSLALNGSRTATTWIETLKKLDLQVTGRPMWSLRKDARFSSQASAIELDELCLAAQGPSLCLSGKGAADGSADATYRIEQLPLALITAIAMPEAQLQTEGMLAGSGEFHRNSKGALNGTARILSTSGRISYPDNAAKPLLEYTDFRVDAKLSPEAQTVAINAALANQGKLTGSVQRTAQDDSLSGQIELHISDLGFVELFSNEIAAVYGSLRGSLILDGHSVAPRVRGTLDLSEFAAEVPIAGLKLHDGKIHLDASDLDQMVLAGQVGSGTGTLTVNGRGGFDAQSPLTIEVGGSDFLAADIPAAHIILSPKLKIVREAGRINASGEISIPTAKIDLTKLPGGGAAATSPDVVIADAEVRKPGDKIPVSGDITVRLGDSVQLKGFGLDGTLAGQLLVLERPGRPTTGRGEIRVGGTYKAYGQDLTIKTGRLLFAGTAIDNPGLDLRAVRALKDVTAGLRVQGTAQVPILTVYSEPAMEQSEALSYLVTGRPLSALRSGEGDLVGAAAQALGSATGNLLAKSIGARLGVDAGVTANATLGGSAFTVGKYLSPKLYLSYGVGLFTPGEVISLRYILSRRWELEAQNATNENRAGINYRFEK